MNTLNIVGLKLQGFIEKNSLINSGKGMIWLGLKFLNDKFDFLKFYLSSKSEVRRKAKASHRMLNSECNFWAKFGIGKVEVDGEQLDLKFYKKIRYAFYSNYFDFGFHCAFQNKQNFQNSWDIFKKKTYCSKQHANFKITTILYIKI